MKFSRIFSVAVLLLGIESTVFAQDVLITQEGDAHKVYEIEIGASSIFYKLENTSGAAIQKIDKNQVLMIKYQDGRKVIIEEEEKEQAATPAPSEQQSQTNAMAFTPEEEAEIAVLNAKFVEEYNQQKVGWTDPKDKKANILFCTFGLKEGTRLQDKNVKIKLESGDFWFHHGGTQTFGHSRTTVNQGILVTVENVSTKTVYIDLGNSFFVRNGEAAPYYVPSATSTTAGTSGGASVNLGSVANAFGIGGVAGTLAGGVNVGGGKSSSSSTVTYAQRVVAIPPKSEIKLEFQKYFLPNSNYWKIKAFKYSKRGECIRIDSDDIEINRGEIITYTEEEKTLSYGVRVAYSLEESCQQTNTLYADLYLRDVMGCRRGGSKAMGGSYYLPHMDRKNLTPNWRDVLYMIVEIW